MTQSFVNLLRRCFDNSLFNLVYSLLEMTLALADAIQPVGNDLLMRSIRSKRCRQHLLRSFSVLCTLCSVRFLYNALSLDSSFALILFFKVSFVLVDYFYWVTRWHKA